VLFRSPYLPAGTSLDTAANVVLNAKQNGIDKPEQIDKVLVKDGRVFVEGKTPGFDCVTNLYLAPPLEQTMKQIDALNQHNDQQQQERQQRQTQEYGGQSR
jgi:putative chitinase